MQVGLDNVRLKIGAKDVLFFAQKNPTKRWRCRTSSIIASKTPAGISIVLYVAGECPASAGTVSDVPFLHGLTFGNREIDDRRVPFFVVRWASNWGPHVRSSSGT